MLAPAQRLRRRRDFTAAIRGGGRAGRGVLVVHLGRGAGTGTARVGLVVPKTVGGAVQRNLVKRRLRHLAREVLHRLPAGSDLVIRAEPGARDRSYPQLAADLDAAVDRVVRRGRSQRGTGPHGEDRR
ncbi:MAG: ribonuclease P protein component [Micromonosporaceae bacterium]|nr:ribonuclease P protein component [Micromonosporaceae bacterium]